MWGITLPMSLCLFSPQLYLSGMFLFIFTLVTLYIFELFNISVLLPFAGVSVDVLGVLPFIFLFQYRQHVLGVRFERGLWRTLPLNIRGEVGKAGEDTKVGMLATRLGWNIQSWTKWSFISLFWPVSFLFQHFYFHHKSSPTRHLRPLATSSVRPLLFRCQTCFPQLAFNFKV